MLSLCRRRLNSQTEKPGSLRKHRPALTLRATYGVAPAFDLLTAIPWKPSSHPVVPAASEFGRYDHLADVDAPAVVELETTRPTSPLAGTALHTLVPT